MCKFGEQIANICLKYYYVCKANTDLLMNDYFSDFMEQ